ncbi:MAG: amidase [Chloroflexota bacterium]|nr:amidase [Chloroflexota bacterium]
MTAASGVDLVVRRLRASLEHEGIRATEADLSFLVESGFLQTVLDFERILESVPTDALPDYLSSLDPPLGSSVDAAGAGDIHVPPATRPTGDRRDRMPSVAEAARLVRAREASPVELAERALALIAAHDPDLNAFQLVLPEQAREAARRAEQELASGTHRGPLHGVPVAVKDLLTMAGTPTTAGSRALAGWDPGYDATAVELLRAAGAVIVGKTRLPELAYSPGSNNAHFGPTRNPWDRQRDTGGSSSGSAAAVSAGLVSAALGSDTGGSIRIPAALCGIVGLKPTFGRVSLHGVVPLSWSLDHLGPLTQSVEDAALLLGVLAGPDPRDPRTVCSRGLPMDLERGASGLRIGVVRDDGSGGVPGEPDVLAAWREGLAALGRTGAELTELDVPELSALRIVSSVILGLEASAYHYRRLRESPESLGPFPRTRLLAAFAYGPHTYVRAQQVRAELRGRMDRLLQTLDLISTPSQPFGAPPLGMPAWTTFTAAFNGLGWPAISVPVGLTSAGLPVGLQLAAKPWAEELVLRAAAVVEVDGPWRGRVPPAS